MFEAGLIEIARFVPEEYKEKGELSMDDFTRQLAIARYVQELEENIILNAVGRMFEE